MRVQKQSDHWTIGWKVEDEQKSKNNDWALRLRIWRIRGAETIEIERVDNKKMTRKRKNDGGGRRRCI